MPKLKAENQIGERINDPKEGGDIYLFIFGLIFELV